MKTPTSPRLVSLADLAYQSYCVATRTTVGPQCPEGWGLAWWHLANAARCGASPAAAYAAYCRHKPRGARRLPAWEELQPVQRRAMAYAAQQAAAHAVPSCGAGPEAAHAFLYGSTSYGYIQGGQ